MDRFWVVLIGYTIFTLVSFFYLGSRRFKVIKGGKAAQWSREAQDRLSMIVRIAFKALAIMLLVTTVVPLIKDIPAIDNGMYKIVEGTASEVSNHSKSLNTYVTINGVRTTFHLSRLQIKEGQKYRVTYLANSSFGLKIETLK